MADARSERESDIAEGLVGGILGEGKDKPEVEAPEPLAGAEAFAAAVAAKLAGTDPEVARDIRHFSKSRRSYLRPKTSTSKTSTRHAFSTCAVKPVRGNPSLWPAPASGHGPAVAEFREQLADSATMLFVPMLAQEDLL